MSDELASALHNLVAELQRMVKTAAEEAARPRPATPPEPWLSKKQAAAHLAVTSRCLTNWQRPEGDGGLALPHRKLPGGTCLYRRSELDAFVAGASA
jgi:hypothetical protein